MRLKLYRATTAALAMGRVRAELGPEALILATRRVADGVEVTAALEPDPPPPPAAAPSPAIRSALAWHGVPAGLQARLRGGGDLTAALAAALRFEALPNAGRPLLFAGPPGAGKTLTIARLATRLVMSGAPPLVVTADARRAGATEQLAAYTRLLGLELAVAEHPVAVARAVAGRRRGAAALIDLAGGDPFVETERQEIAALAGALAAAVVAVLPAALDALEAAELAAAYREAGAVLLVATRLDCARRLGGVLTAATALPLAELGVGPGAADGLVPASADLLAGWLARKIPQDALPDRMP
jgi:flagellar biosynthesis protein FlhF